MANLFRLNLSGRKKENNRIGKNQWKTIQVAIFNFAVGLTNPFVHFIHVQSFRFLPSREHFFLLHPLHYTRQVKGKIQP